MVQSQIAREDPDTTLGELKSFPGSLRGKPTLLTMASESPEPLAGDAIRREQSVKSETSASSYIRVSQEEKKLRLHASALKTRDSIRKRREEAMAKKLAAAAGEPGKSLTYRVLLV